MTYRAVPLSFVLVAAACSNSTSQAPPVTPTNEPADETNIATAPADEAPANLDPSVPPKTITNTSESAKAVLTSPEGVEGTITFEPGEATVVMHAEIRGLAPGKHGFHIHENGDCATADFSSAGGHFAPRAHEHGAPTDAEHHVGDLGNLEVGADGVVSLEMNTDFDVSPDGPASILGKAIIVHEKADDLHSQPSGDAGRRIACGVIAPGA